MELHSRWGRGSKFVLNSFFGFKQRSKVTRARGSTILSRGSSAEAAAEAAMTPKTSVKKIDMLPRKRHSRRGSTRGSPAEAI